MDFNAYQEFTRTTAIYADPIYPVLGLTEEAGEVAGKVAKSLRDNTALSEEVITKELGDVIWMVTRIADDMGIDLQTVVETNVRKLKDRQSRNKLSGSGDDR